jgi:hypothetical protein
MRFTTSVVQLPGRSELVVLSRMVMSPAMVSGGGS